MSHDFKYLTYEVVDYPAAIKKGVYLRSIIQHCVCCTNYDVRELGAYRGVLLSILDNISRLEIVYKMKAGEDPGGFTVTLCAFYDITATFTLPLEMKHPLNEAIMEILQNLEPPGFRIQTEFMVEPRPLTYDVLLAASYFGDVEEECGEPSNIGDYLLHTSGYTISIAPLKVSGVIFDEGENGVSIVTPISAESGWEVVKDALALVEYS